MNKDNPLNGLINIKLTNTMKRRREPKTGDGDDESSIPASTMRT